MQRIHAESLAHVLVALLPVDAAYAQASVQTYRSPRLFGTNGHTNDFLVRPTIPISPGEPIGVLQIFRATVPLSARPDPEWGYKTDLGDVNLEAPHPYPLSQGGVGSTRT